MEEHRRARIRRDKNLLTIPDRIGEIVGIFFTLLIAAFFIYNQTTNTGFMTSKFGLTATILFYGSFALSIVNSIAKATIGRRDTARPFELVSNVFTAIAALWFLSVFPFNFAHLADALPSFLRFILSWITNGIGWIIILLSAIVSIIVALANVIRIALDWI